MILDQEDTAAYRECQKLYKQISESMHATSTMPKFGSKDLTGYWSDNWQSNQREAYLPSELQLEIYERGFSTFAVTHTWMQGEYSSCYVSQTNTVRLTIYVEGENDLLKNGESYNARPFQANLVLPGDDMLNRANRTATIGLHWQPSICPKSFVKILSRTSHLESGYWISTEQTLAILRHIQLFLAQDEGPLHNSNYIIKLEDSLTDCIMESIDNSSGHYHQQTSDSHLELATEAIITVLAAPTRSFSVIELADKLHCSTRTVQNAFEAVTEQSPAKFIRDMKIRSAKCAFMDQEHSTKIKRTAEEHGFLNYGRFVKAYSSLYREAPSETVTRFRHYSNLLDRSKF